MASQKCIDCDDDVAEGILAVNRACYDVGVINKKEEEE